MSQHQPYRKYLNRETLRVLPEGIVLSSARPLLIAPDEDDEPHFIEGGKERRELRQRLEKGVQLEEENRELREKIRRLQEELRRL